MIQRQLHFQPLTKTLIILCCLFHWLALFVAYFPAESPLKQTLFKPFSGYLGALGFNIAPPFSLRVGYPQSIQLMIEAKHQAASTIEEFSPLIPDFSKGQGSHLVSLVFLQLVSLPQDSSLLSTYATQVCKNLKRIHGSLFESITFRFDLKLLRTLEETRNDGELAYLEVTKRGPYLCARE